MPLHALYGAPPAGLCPIPPGAEQFSPLVPGSRSLEELSGELASLTMLAPPGTIERRYVLALAIRALAPGAGGTVLAPKDKGGSRLAKELRAFGVEFTEDARQHHRICRFTRPRDPAGCEEAIREGALRFSEELKLWTQPGVFSWDRLDPGSLLLLTHLPPLAGRGADLGCGLGVLSRRVLESRSVRQLHLADIDGRSVAAAKKNVIDPRAVFHWADVRVATVVPTGLDFVVTNPPFHEGGAEDQSLGQVFVRKSAALLREGGVCWLVANRHLPYEEALREAFTEVRLRADSGAYKIYEALR
jgi:16S rRNA (guanine1207-N2)-methyltransferase